MLGARALCGPERLDFPIELPELHFMPVSKLLGEPCGFCVVLAHEVYAILDVTSLSQNEGAVTPAWHGLRMLLASPADYRV